jgi:phosphoribosylanthranilate isomerase
MSTTVKICGISSEDMLKAAVSCGADKIGFVHFAKSPRHIELKRSAELKEQLPAHVESVIVVVNPDDALLSQIVGVIHPAYIQLHGKESPERVKEIHAKFPKQKLIKAVSVRNGDDIAKVHAYAAYVDLLMFDAKAPESSALPGGNGLSFDWELLKNREFDKPWILSGGLTPENVKEAIEITGATAVDVSSGVESSPGVKDAALIKAFINAAK